jgi:hypothetical protein
MQLTPPEYNLIKYLQDLNKIFISTDTVPIEELKEFCSLFLRDSIAGIRFTAMFESCYDNANQEQFQFYNLARKIDDLIVAKMVNVPIFKEYDRVISSIMGGAGATSKRYIEMKTMYSKNDSFQFLSVVCPKKVKATKELFKFDPANLM